MKIRTGKVHVYALEQANKARDRFAIIRDLILFDIMHSQYFYGFQLHADHYTKHTMLSW